MYIDIFLKIPYNFRVADKPVHSTKKEVDMRHYLPEIPHALLDRPYVLPVEEPSPHNQHSETMMPHRLFGWSDQAAGRIVHFVHHPDQRTYRFEGEEMGKETPRRIRQQTRVLATASFLEGARRRTNGTTPFEPTDGVGVVPLFPKARELLLTRKDHLYPHRGYCGRLAFLGGGIDAHEHELWDHDGRRATVAMCREVYEEILDLDVADEITRQMGYVRRFDPTCFLWSGDGTPRRGRLHLFFCLASSETQWRHWCDVLVNRHGLGEGSPLVLCTDTTLRAALEQERAARLDAERPGRAQPFPPGTTLLDRPPYTQAWKRQREAEQAAGRFPLREQDFAFIAGHGAVLEEALHEWRLYG